MNDKNRVLFAVTCILIVISAVLVTSWYTSDLEMLWLVAFLIVPLWAAVFGFVVSLILKFLTKSDFKTVIWIVGLSVIIHTGLMVEEASISVIKNSFDNHAMALNNEEQARTSHEVYLGEGKSLYFSGNNDTEFQLNFEFMGKRTISRDTIMDLAKQWLTSKGYGISEITEIQAYPKFYRKGISFQLESPGEIFLTVDLKEDPDVPQGKLDAIMLGLKFKNESFTFEERGWTYK